MYRMKSEKEIAKEIRKHYKPIVNGKLKVYFHSILVNSNYFFSYRGLSKVDGL
jgi:hypothetical protein